MKILDFGLANLTPQSHAPDDATLPSQTEPGIVMGTVDYMSPEQSKGQVADHRSDLFRFGTILYEMLSGKRAFCGRTAEETMSAILSGWIGPSESQRTESAEKRSSQRDGLRAAATSPTSSPNFKADMPGQPGCESRK